MSHSVSLSDCEWFNTLLTKRTNELLSPSISKFGWTYQTESKVVVGVSLVRGTVSLRERGRMFCDGRGLDVVLIWKGSALIFVLSTVRQHVKYGNDYCLSVFLGRKFLLLFSFWQWGVANGSSTHLLTRWTMIKRSHFWT